MSSRLGERFALTGRKYAFLKKEQGQIDLGMCCLILSSSLWEVQPVAVAEELIHHVPLL